MGLELLGERELPHGPKAVWYFGCLLDWELPVPAELSHLGMLQNL